jgi:multidrug efflux pump subunit AcrA (membrane-fusion protein)
MTRDNDIKPVEAEAELPREIIAPPPPTARLPAVQPSLPKQPRRQHPWKRALVLAVLLIAASGIGYWWFHRAPELPPGFASGNGRLEADEIDIDTKFAGRIAKLFVDEGDMVKAGQTVAEMDTQDLRAQLNKSEAVVRQSERALEEAQKNLAQQQQSMQQMRTPDAAEADEAIPEAPPSPASPRTATAAEPSAYVAQVSSGRASTANKGRTAALGPNGASKPCRRPSSVGVTSAEGRLTRCALKPVTSPMPAASWRSG